MKVNIEGICINYERNFGFGPIVLLLHGWGVDGTIFKGIYDYLSSIGMNTVVIDFPGFGKSGAPNEGWGIYDYADIIHKFIMELSLDEVILVGHSFGGRIALILASDRHEYIKKIVLISSAGLKPKFSLKKKIKVLKYKYAKKHGKDVSSYGSDDYKNLTPQMQKIFVRIVNTFLNDRLKNIICPTLIIWGEHDTQTPLYMARKLNLSIEKSILEIFEGCGHFCFLEQPEKCNIILDGFIRR